ncbi:MAG: MAPEG family protein [Rhodoferax sp.]|nr:MAPEG family protein [Rhodoferax sp.]
MAWVEIVTALALLQYLYFGALVSKARGEYGVKAPAILGHEMFERLYRVQMNTLELLVVFLPGLWLAALHWSPVWMAAVGVVYLVGRQVYLQAYRHSPAGRSLGFTLSALPAIGLLLAGLVGAVLTVFK